MSWFVEVLDRDGAVRSRWPVQGAELRIGRALDNDLVLDDPHCAAHHACVRVTDDGVAMLDDLGTLNGITQLQGKARVASVVISDDRTFRLGQSLLRVRSSQWELPPEKPLNGRTIWPWAVFALSLVLGYSLWEVWLGDVEDKSPPYLYTVSGVVLVMGAWSAMYALLGRLINGEDRFSSHLLIASTGYLCMVIADETLGLLSFASGWLWPLRIGPYVLIVLVALVVRRHLRLADPRHWPATRWGVLFVTLGALLVPVAQSWITHRRLTDVQMTNLVAHPNWLLADPVSADAFSEQVVRLKAEVDRERHRSSGEESSDWDDEDD